MNNNTTAPTYTLRGLQLIGWRDMQHALDYLFADGQLKQGTLVAINAEKMLTIEDNAEVRELINAAEFKYADGISVVRSVRKKYPQAQVSRVAGADLWEELMARAGKEGTPVFLVGGKPEVLAQTEAKLRNQWNVNIFFNFRNCLCRFNSRYGTADNFTPRRLQFQYLSDRCFYIFCMGIGHRLNQYRISAADFLIADCYCFRMFPKHLTLLFLQAFYCRI